MELLREIKGENTLLSMSLTETTTTKESKENIINHNLIHFALYSGIIQFEWNFEMKSE
jgi:hypothetical protein